MTYVRLPGTRAIFRKNKSNKQIIHKYLINTSDSSPIDNTRKQIYMHGKIRENRYKKKEQYITVMKKVKVFIINNESMK